MDHSYEEIRRAAIDVIAGREKTKYDPSQYVHLRIGVAEVLQRRDGIPKDPSGRDPKLTAQDRDIFLEVFWDLFRQGIITLGANDSNPEFPFFRISSSGQKILENDQVYFFHDLSSFEKLIRDEIPEINETTLLYLKEAMQAYYVDCRLSSAVMLGVALEDTLNRLYNTISQNSEYKDHFAKVMKEKFMLPRFSEFRKKLNGIKKDLPKGLTEDLESNLDMIVSLIRNFRNESGHPSEKILSREQSYVNLQLFVPCCKKIYALIAFFDGDGSVSEG